MKEIICDYIQHCKERGELDFILPNVLSALGYTNISEPLKPGAAQHGVDLMVVGNNDILSGEPCEETVFLFAVKPGNLTRNVWDSNTNQSLRRTLNQVKDSFICNHIPSQYKKEHIVVCSCIGGVVEETVREDYEGFLKSYSKKIVSLNCEHLTNLVMRARELSPSFVPAKLEGDLRIAATMSMVPDESEAAFASYIRNTTNDFQKEFGALIVLAWSRKNNNLTSGFLAMKHGICSVLNSCLVNGEGCNLKAFIDIFLHVCEEYFEKFANLFPKQFGVTSAAMSMGGYALINMKMFSFLGDFSLFCLAKLLFASKDEFIKEADSLNLLIKNNPILLYPISEYSLISFMLTIIVLSVSGKESELKKYLSNSSNVAISGIYKSRYRLSSNPESYALMMQCEFNIPSESSEVSSCYYPFLILMLVSYGMKTQASQVIEALKKNVPEMSYQVICFESAASWGEKKFDERFVSILTDSNQVCCPIEEFLAKITNDQLKFTTRNKYEQFEIFLSCFLEQKPIPIAIFESFITTDIDVILQEHTEK